MQLRPHALALQDDKERRADNGDQVQRQIDDVPVYGLGRELAERALEHASEASHRIGAWFEFAVRDDEVCCAGGYQGLGVRISSIFVEDKR